MTRAIPTASASRPLAAGSLISFAGSAISAALGFVLTVVVTRMLGDVGSGVFFQMMAAFTIALGLARVGADSTAVWLLPRQVTDAVADLRGTTTRLLATGLVGGVAATAGLIAITPLLFPDPAVAAAVVTAAWFLPAASVMLVALSATRGLGGIGPYVGVGSVALPAARIVGVAGGAALTGSVVAAAFGWSVPLVVAAVIAVAILARQVRRHERRSDVIGVWRTDPATTARIRRYSIPRLVSSTLEQGLLWLDVIIVGLIAGPAAAGVYGGATRLVAAGLIVDTALRVVVSPRFSALLGQGRIAEVEALYRTAARWLVLFSTPVYLVLGLFAPVVLGWFGGEFVAGAATLSILCAGAIVTFLAGNIHSVLLMSGRSGLAATNKAVALGVNVLGNIVLVPILGIDGAAISWAASMLVDAALAAVQVSRFVGLRLDLVGVLYALLVPTAAIGGTGAIALMALGPSLPALVVTVVVGGAIFATWSMLDRRRLQLAEIFGLARR